MREINDHNFTTEVLENSRPVLVDFWAPWCGPCRALAPVLEKISQKRDDLEIVKLNIDDSPETAAQYSVMSIPTMILFKDGNPAGQLVGSQPEQKIEAELERLL